MTKHRTTWIVVANGGHAKIMTHREETSGYVLVAAFESADARHLTRDLVSDRAGRVQESAYSGRHAIEPHTDPHEAKKREFMRTLGKYLNEKNAHCGFDELVVFAAPHCLHALRETLDADTAKKVKYEAAQDLVKLPIAELSQHIEKTRREEAERSR